MSRFAHAFQSEIQILVFAGNHTCSTRHWHETNGKLLHSGLKRLRYLPDSDVGSVIGSLKVTTDHSSGSFPEHSLGPIIHNTPEFANPNPVGSANPPSDGEKLRADGTHPAHSGSHNNGTDAFSALIFRVECPGSPAQRLQLTGERYTIGTAEGCSIRLRDTKLLPIHAILLHEHSSVHIRAHSEPVVINGKPLTESEINIGDMLQLGGYRFELISIKRTDATVNAQSSLTNALPPAVERAIAESTLGSRQATPHDPPELHDLVLQSRLEACLHREQLCSKREGKLIDDQENLKFREQEMTRRIARLEAEESSSLELYDQLSKRQSEINSLRQSLQEKKALHLQRETDFQSEKREQETKLEELSEALLLAKGEFETESEKTQTLRADFEAMSKVLDETQQQKDLLELKEQLQRREHEQLVRKLELDLDRLVAEKAENQAQLRSMESGISELETLVASANEMDTNGWDSDEENREDDGDPINSEAGSSSLPKLSQHPSSDSVAEDNDREASVVESSEDAAKQSSPGHLVSEADSVVSCDSMTPAVDEQSDNSLNQALSLDQVSGTKPEVSNTATNKSEVQSLAELIEISRQNSELIAELEERRHSNSNVKELESQLADTTGRLKKIESDHREAVELIQSLLDKEQEQPERDKRPIFTADDSGETSPKKASWNSLLHSLGNTSLSDEPAADAAENPAQGFSPVADEKQPNSEDQVESDDENEDDDSWFQSGMSSGNKPKNKDLRSVRNPNANTKKTLFAGKENSQDPLQSDFQSDTRAAVGEMLWSGARQQPDQNQRSNSQNPIIRTDDHAESVEDSVNRLLDRSKPAQASASERQASDSHHRANAEGDRARAAGNLSSVSNERNKIISRLTKRVQSMFSTNTSSGKNPAAYDQAVLVRYAFAFGAVAAGLICFRLVPGNLKYIALAMALILAAIYTQEGREISRQQTS